MQRPGLHCLRRSRQQRLLPEDAEQRFPTELVVTIAREGLEDKYSLRLNPEWRLLKNRTFLGSISQQNIRARQRPRIEELGSLSTPTSPGAGAALRSLA